jgi:uncharacterized protein (TIGR00251 family)
MWSDVWVMLASSDMTTDFDLRERDGGVRLPLFVQPRASRSGVTGIHGGVLRVALKSPPVDGKANAELIKWIARKLGVPKSAVRIVSGQSGRRKMVDIEGVDAEKVRRELFGGG